jgi:hypothetical protein
MQVSNVLIQPDQRASGPQSHQQHAIDGDHAGVPFPFLQGVHCPEHERRDVLWSRRVDSKENHATSVERSPLLNCELPKVLVDGQQHPALLLRQIQKPSVCCAGMIRPHPGHVLARLPQRLDGWQREVFIRNEAHQTGSGYALYSWAR